MRGALSRASHDETFVRLAILRMLPREWPTTRPSTGCVRATSINVRRLDPLPMTLGHGLHFHNRETSPQYTRLVLSAIAACPASGVHGCRVARFYAQGGVSWSSLLGCLISVLYPSFMMMGVVFFGEELLAWSTRNQNGISCVSMMLSLLEAMFWEQCWCIRRNHALGYLNMKQSRQRRIPCCRSKRTPTSHLQVHVVLSPKTITSQHVRTFRPYR